MFHLNFFLLLLLLCVCVCVIREEFVTFFSFLRTNITTVWNNSLKMICHEVFLLALLVKLLQILVIQTHINPNVLFPTVLKVRDS